MGYGTDGIHNEVAYANAVRRNIIGNAHKTWLKADERHEGVYEYLRGFLPLDRDNWEPTKFIEKMAQSLFCLYGKLSPKQVDAVIKYQADTQARREAFTKAVEEQKARSAFLGLENERREFKLHVDKMVEIEVPKFNYYDSGIMRMFLMRDQDGNRVVYKTKSAWYLTLQDGICSFVHEGDDITIKGTIKAHTEYKGEKQTIIQRAKVLSIAVKETEEA
jgi:hypothetical protein